MKDSFLLYEFEALDAERIFDEQNVPVIADLHDIPQATTIKAFLAAFSVPIQESRKKELY